jgi:cytochrome c553
VLYLIISLLCGQKTSSCLLCGVKIFRIAGKNRLLLISLIDENRGFGSDLRLGTHLVFSQYKSHWKKKGKVVFHKSKKSKAYFSSEEIVTVCAWCHRAKYVGEDHREVWVEHFHGDDEQAISHTICPSCKEKMMSEVAELAFA